MSISLIERYEYNYANPGSPGVTRTSSHVRENPEFLKSLEEARRANEESGAVAYLQESKAAYFEVDFKKAAELAAIAKEMGGVSADLSLSSNAWRSIGPSLSYYRDSNLPERSVDGKLTSGQSDYLLERYGTGKWDDKTRENFYFDIV
jgi:hypothetical protein